MAESKKRESNEIYVGDKPFMKYVTATLMQLKNQENPEVIIKARGKFISRAVDIAEVAKKRTLENDNLEIKHEVKIGTDNFKNEEGKDINISTIDIFLRK